MASTEEGGPESITQPTDHAPLALTPTRGSGVYLLAVTALAALGGLAVMILGNSIMDRLVGALLFTVCGFIAFGGGRILLRRQPLLLVTSAGLEHPKVGLIPFDEIERLTITDSVHGRRLNVEVRDQASYQRRVQSRSLRSLMRLDVVSRGPLLSFPEKLVPMGLEDFLAEIEARAGRSWPH